MFIELRGLSIIMIYLYNVLLFEPIFNLLIFLYNIIPYKDIGVSILLLTLVIKLVLLPLSLKSIRSQKALQDLQPKLEKLKKEFGEDKERLGQEMIKLYKEQKVNPLSSCLPLLIQLPFFLAVYQVFRSGLASAHFDILYPFVQNPGSINTMFLGFLDLAQPQGILAVLAGGSQYIQAKMMSTKQPPKQLQEKEGAKDENALAAMNKQMMYVMPLITVVIGFSLPGGLTLYWLITTLLTIAQYHFFLHKKDKNEGDVEVIRSAE